MSLACRAFFIVFSVYGSGTDGWRQSAPGMRRAWFPDVLRGSAAGHASRAGFATQQPIARTLAGAMRLVAHREAAQRAR
jgi:hypothetical protein